MGSANTTKAGVKPSRLYGQGGVLQERFGQKDMQVAALRLKTQVAVGRRHKVTHLRQSVPQHAMVEAVLAVLAGAGALRVRGLDERREYRAA